MLQFDKTGSGDLTNGDLSHRYLWGPAVDQLLADEQIDWTDTYADGPVYWGLPDHLGTIRDVVDNSGTVVDHAQYDSFGKRLNAAAVDVVFGYTGKLLDEYTGKVYHRFRWYEPDTARFTSEDPIQSGTNWTIYVGNKSTMFVDPDGLKEEKPTYWYNDSGWDWLNPWAYPTPFRFLINTFTDHNASFDRLAEQESRAKANDPCKKTQAGDIGTWNGAGSQLSEAAGAETEILGFGRGVVADIVIEGSTLSAGGLVVWLRRGGQVRRLGLIDQLGLSFDDQRKLLRLAMNSVKSGKIAHHLIPLEAITKYRALLERAAKGGFNINGCKNGILLGKGDHLWNHPEYNKAVLRELGNIPPGWSAERIAARLQEIADMLRKAIEDGTFGPWG